MYYLNKTTTYSFAEAEQKIREALKEKGFGILTEIDLKATLKTKLDKDIQQYKILGACNPNFAYQALQQEEKIGIMLPCNVTIIENKNGTVDVSIVDPIAAFEVVKNKTVEPFAKEVKAILEAALESI
ncbi:MAG: DUF302 domain-containing protein [Flavobacteriales bacterium]|nr:DUF302 domain-containing protein [Flavobacteriales bacterium]MCB9174220.1 DUF302 domain-containing protein [Flavobacteriales bacterium]